MPKKKNSLSHEKDSDQLKGWQAIAQYLSQPVAVAERWAKQSGMPVSRQGRSVVASREELNRWLGRESGEPVQIATESSDLAADLKRGLSYVRSHRNQPAAKSISKNKT